MWGRRYFFVAIVALSLVSGGFSAISDAGVLSGEIKTLAATVEPKVIEWRRDFHQNPELSNREFRTSKIIAELLTKMGMEVQTGIAHTGVVGILRGKKDGPVVGLRADMDALPVKELTGLPFASKAKGEYNGKEVDIMHACGHDNHMAILLGAASVLSQLKDKLPGTVKFIFQPAEEGSPVGEEGGADLMIAEGVLKNPDVDAIFGLHVFPTPSGTISYREGGLLASADTFEIKVTGKQCHGGMPWFGVDPVVVSAQIILGLQTIVSREANLTTSAAVITVGKISGGVRNNIVPSEVEMVGTIRALDPSIRELLHAKITQRAENIAKASGATAEVKINKGTPVTFNNVELTRAMVPTLQGIVGKEHCFIQTPVTGAEDFAFYTEKIPAMFFVLGTRAKDAKFYPNHSPYFDSDEKALVIGVKAMANLAVDYLNSH